MIVIAVAQFYSVADAIIQQTQRNVY